MTGLVWEFAADTVYNSSFICIQLRRENSIIKIMLIKFMLIFVQTYKPCKLLEMLCIRLLTSSARFAIINTSKIFSFEQKNHSCKRFPVLLNINPDFTRI